MFEQGPVPAFVHGVVEYAFGILLIAAPFLFSFEDDAATAVAIAAGVLLLIIAASTAFFLVLGVAHLLLTIATRFIRDERPRRASRAER